MLQSVLYLKSQNMITLDKSRADQQEGVVGEGEHVEDQGHEGEGGGQGKEEV